jgi:hypothetical protein
VTRFLCHPGSSSHHRLVDIIIVSVSSTSRHLFPTHKTLWRRHHLYPGVCLPPINDSRLRHHVISPPIPRCYDSIKTTNTQILSPHLRERPARYHHRGTGACRATQLLEHVFRPAAVWSVPRHSRNRVFPPWVKYHIDHPPIFTQTLSKRPGVPSMTYIIISSFIWNINYLYRSPHTSPLYAPCLLELSLLGWEYLISLLDIPITPPLDLRIITPWLHVHSMPILQQLLITALGMQCWPKCTESWSVCSQPLQ